MSDRRVQITRQIFYDTLVSLLEKKSLSQITIKELCEKADLNRSTFYAHYQNIGDVYSEIEKNFLSHMIYIDSREQEETSIQKLIQLAQYVRKNKRTFLILMNNGGFDTRCAMHAKQLMAENRPSFRSNQAEITNNLLISYSVVGTNALLREWLMADQDIPVRQIASLIYRVNESLDNLNRGSRH